MSNFNMYTIKSCCEVNHIKNSRMSIGLNLMLHTNWYSMYLMAD